MLRPKRIIGLSAAVVLIVVAAAMIWMDYVARPRLVAGPMVQSVSTEGFTLVWQMHPAKPVRLRVSERGEGKIVFDGLAEPGTYQYENAIGHLKPDQLYDYAIGEHDVELGTTRTAPHEGMAFRFLAFGDSGVGRSSQYELARQFGNWQPDLIIHTGDLVYPDGERKDYYRKFFSPYAQLLRRVPFYPCLGNHDMHTREGGPFLETFVLPTNGPESQKERCFWFDYSDVRFVAIDSNNDLAHFRDVVSPWLDGVLTDAGERWKIVFFHEPMYTHGKYQEGAKLIESIGPVIDRHEVELVLSGHDHMYERTHPLRGGELVAAGMGTVHVTTGAGGARLYRQRPNPPRYLAAYNDKEHSFTIVDVTREWLVLRQIGEIRRSIDEVHIPRRAGRRAMSQPAQAAIGFDGSYDLATFEPIHVNCSLATGVVQRSKPGPCEWFVRAGSSVGRATD